MRGPTWGGSCTTRESETPFRRCRQGFIICLMPERFIVLNLRHLALVEQVQAVLESAGLLRPVPER